ncbi:MAG: L-lactate dehydrogenase [Ktedonobacterales bacterium]|jgi:isopentenyl diphosphate isomerase/L-lactate dehydrogenase-like FMN-dependent dehydrogenase|nr:MAG: L-lactate dehydrogenase [Ktedonobacterales bacterium]
MEPHTLFDYEALAEPRLDRPAWLFYSGGAGHEVTLRANRDAFDRIRLLPRMLQGAKAADLRTRVLGAEVSMPILVAPTAFQGLACPDGECATASAASAVGTLMVAATEATRSLEEIAAVATAPLWFQLYVYDNQRALAESLVRRAEDAGYRAIAVTVDAPRWGRKDRSIGHDFDLLPGMGTPNVGDIDLEPAALSWRDMDWLRSLTSLPLLLKGILTPQDALLALAHGADGIIVSNHGARQLDTVPATIEALPAIAEAIAGRCELYLDGGVRRGIDVMKALALGARAVLIGRPILWGLAVNGPDGARHVLELLRDELELAMVLAGRPTIASIDASLVRL